MKMYFDSPIERDLAQEHNILASSDFFFADGKLSVEWITVKSGFEIQILFLIFS